tara:strand:+ start:693 stop:1073 length:381 start_codon:yes stop_codon:yes gene_type:complete
MGDDYKNTKMILVSLVVLVAVGMVSNSTPQNITGNYLYHEQSTTACVDSDGGINPFVKGTVDYTTDKSFQTRSKTDSCQNSFIVKEFSCDPETGKFQEYRIACDVELNSRAKGRCDLPTGVCILKD